MRVRARSLIALPPCPSGTRRTTPLPLWKDTYSSSGAPGDKALPPAGTMVPSEDPCTAGGGGRACGPSAGSSSLVLRSILWPWREESGRCQKM
eukprot:scaffold21681_cov27-Tisochrysis_lutea.AAC.6